MKKAHIENKKTYVNETFSRNLYNYPQATQQQKLEQSYQPAKFKNTKLWKNAENQIAQKFRTFFLTMHVLFESLQIFWKAFPKKMFRWVSFAMIMLDI